MKLPARFVIGNMVWSRDGSIWAVYRVKSKSYPYLSDREKLQEHSRVRMALMSLPAESMILSICQEISTESVIDDMITGMNDDNEAWLDAVDATFDSIDGVPLYQRIHYLAVSLPSDGVKADTFS